MIDHRLCQELDGVASRYRRLRYWNALAAAWFVAAGVAFLAWGLGRAAGSAAPLPVPLLCVIGVSLAGFAVWLAATLAPPRVWVAHRVASAYPELRHCLLAAIEQQPDLPDGRFGYLQSSVIQEALDHANFHSWDAVVPNRRIKTAMVAQFVTFTLFLIGLMTVAFWKAPPVIAATAAKDSQHKEAASGYSVVVEPGNVEIEKGTSLLVLARVTGQMPAEAALVFQTNGGAATQLPMPLSLNDPVFGARIAIVNEPLEYHVDLDGRKTPVHHVTVFEYPRLERADARLVYPKYAGMEDRLVQDIRTVSVVEGSEVTLICRLNKPVATAQLVESAKAPPVDLALADGESNVYQVTLHPDKSRRFKLALVDEAGRSNVQTAELAIHVIPNQAPVLKPIQPARDVEVSAIEELDLKVTAWDDFGLIRAGVTYGLAGKEPVDIVLAENAAARTRHELAHTIRLEDLKAEPDQLLAYHFWSEDYGPDGAVRRTSSDMYFAEVRPWEEIYRQGEQPAGGEQRQREQQQGQGENAQRAEQLAKLQKDIINATWKLIRRETGAKPSPPFAADAEQVEQSQVSAREKAEGLGGRLEDPESAAHLAMVLEQMEQAASQLKSAHEGPVTAPLPAALAAEQAAYQALLKLRAREFQVVQQQRRQQQSQSASSNSPRSDQQRQQMQQLQLANDENRYETQRMAQSQAQSQQQKQEERETRQVLNRLNELARRQHDLNERVKDLQSSLAESATRKEREEARRQLQRLQEEQQQVLRDTDELSSRMDTAENQERMSEERQQLEQTREQVQRASESLQEERVTQAAASGTRAERDFEDLRNEFRRRAAGRFGEEVQQMRADARELDRREKELGERLKQAANPDPANKSLRDDGQRPRIQQDLADQRKRLADLTERMRQTIQEAEQTEPLLSERLYDAARNAQNKNVDKALQGAEGSVRRGLVDDAREQEQAAGQGISQLREGVERAAESVLGDEAEGLRRARDELRTLADELNREIARNSSEGRGQQEEGERSAGQQRGAGERGGEQQPGVTAGAGASAGGQATGDRAATLGRTAKADNAKQRVSNRRMVKNRTVPAAPASNKRVSSKPVNNRAASSNRAKDKKVVALAVGKEALSRPASDSAAVKANRENAATDSNLVKGNRRNRNRATDKPVTGSPKRDSPAVDDSQASARRVAAKMAAANRATRKMASPTKRGNAGAKAGEAHEAPSNRGRNKARAGREVRPAAAVWAPSTNTKRVPFLP